MCSSVDDVCAALPHPCTLAERAAFVDKLQGAAAKIAPDVACLSASVDAVSQWGIRAAQYFAEDPAACPPERLCGTSCYRRVPKFRLIEKHVMFLGPQRAREGLARGKPGL